MPPSGESRGAQAVVHHRVRYLGGRGPEQRHPPAHRDVVSCSYEVRVEGPDRLGERSGEPEVG